MSRSLVLVTAIVAAFVAAVVSSKARADEPRARLARAPVPLDAVGAIVDDVFIFRSEVVARAHHFESKLSRDPIQRRGELVALEKQLLVRIVDETLVSKDAAKLHIEATDAEVATGIESVAQANNITRKQLEVEVLKASYSLLEYQAEIRRQILEQKWLLSHTAGKIDRKKTADVAAFTMVLEQQRELLLATLRSHAYIEIR